MINETLGLEDFKSFLYDEETLLKINYFIDVPEESTLEDKALSLATFSAFAEGCLLFSSFAVLLSFQRENLMKGVSQIVSFSVRDENIHSEGGCWLFRTLCEENDGLREKLQSKIEKVAHEVFKLEERFINHLFEDGDIRTLSSYDLIQFIQHRINIKLVELGYKEVFDIDQKAIERMSWFYTLSGAREFGDFFAVRVTEYTKVEYKPEDLF